MLDPGEKGAGFSPKNVPPPKKITFLPLGSLKGFFIKRGLWPILRLGSPEERQDSSPQDFIVTQKSGNSGFCTYVF